jgi:hypothetical protein
VGRRNNAGRLKPPRPDFDSSTPTNLTNDTEDLFSFVNPTEFVELPSRGQFYPEDHPLHNIDTIEIKHMTAKEEDILTSETLLKKGVAINRMVDSLIVDKNIQVRKLLLGDKNAILIAARITGFGPDYAVNTTCPSCYEKADNLFNLNEIVEADVTEMPSEVEVVENGLFALELPISKVRLTVKLLTAADEERLVQATSAKKKFKKESSVITDLLKAIVVAANDHTDRQTIDKFVEMIPLQDVSYLRRKYEKVKPDMDIKFDFECPACSFVGKVVMPMTAEFFWPKR